MTHVIRVRNVEEALGEGFQHLKISGLDESSRNGPVRVAPGPVITEYSDPRERVVFNTTRDANPVFHLLEAIWMLAGSDDVGFILPYNGRMVEYAEVHGMIHGAYGRRWRRRFGKDQILKSIEMLTKQPNTRRVVIQMWSAELDLGENKKDLPCNTHIYLDRINGALNMTVCCRSNDILWGAYGANAVHFSVLQELIALGAGVPVGVYRQFSNNFHAYTENEVVKTWLESPPFREVNDYPHKIIPLLIQGESVQDFLDDCTSLVRATDAGWKTTFFFRVVAPLKGVYDARKIGVRTWRSMLERAEDCDWKDSFVEWAERRAK